MYGTLLAGAGWQKLVQKVSSDVGLVSPSNCPYAFGHASRDSEMVVHGDDPDRLSQKLNQKLLLVAEGEIGSRA